MFSHTKSKKNKVQKLLFCNKKLWRVLELRRSHSERKDSEKESLGKKPEP